MQRLFRAHFPQLVARYEAEFARRLGKFRLERITKAVERFLGCGDYRRGVARIKCTNPDCGLEYFRPFSCSVLHLCPSCSQKRTLRLGEYMNEQLQLRLPHKQFVFTLPKVLRVFFRHDKRLHGEISRLIYALVRDFTIEAAGKPVRAAAVVVFQSSGSFCRFHPHWHGLFLEGGFDDEGRFVHIPTVDLAKMSGCFRQRVVAFFLERKLLNERLAKNMLGWTHSGFSVDASIRIPAGSAATREALAQYIVRPPVSLQHLLLDEGGTDTVLYRAPYSDYFRTDTKLFPAIEFLAEVLQHVPD
ncbi:MAG: transposase [Spirochaetia bacterium]